MNAPAKNKYPTRPMIRRALDEARACGLDVAGYEISPEGVIRVFEARAQQSAVNDFDRWADKL